MNKEEFIKNVSNLGIDLSEKQLEQLEIYAKFLIEYNSHTNLTTINTIEDIYLKHFYDSLTIVDNNIVDFNKVNTLVDVGTGAGFPGMVLKIVYPRINVILIDSNNKKTKFLTELKNKLNLDKIKILNVRSEEYARDNLDKYDVVTSRAVANLRVLTELCLPMVKVNGYFIPLKSSVEEELKEAKSVINKLNGKLEYRKEFNLPRENSLRNILFINKTDITPKGYPRAYGKIKKG